MKRSKIQIEEVHVERVIDLRWKILRAGLPRESAHFPGDDEPTTHHFAALHSERIVGCVSFLLNQWENSPAWQIRGMAVDANYQSQGIGSLLLRHGIGVVNRTNPLPLWCTARQSAVQFYLNHGWQIVGELFDIPTAGPHFKMVKRP